MGVISVEYTKELDDDIKKFVRFNHMNLYAFLKYLWFEKTTIYKWRLRKSIALSSYNIVAEALWLPLITSMYSDWEKKKQRKLVGKEKMLKLWKLLQKAKKKKTLMDDVEWRKRKRLKNRTEKDMKIKKEREKKRNNKIQIRRAGQIRKGRAVYNKHIRIQKARAMRRKLRQQKKEENV